MLSLLKEDLYHAIITFFAGSMCFLLATIAGIVLRKLTKREKYKLNKEDKQNFNSEEIRQLEEVQKAINLEEQEEIINVASVLKELNPDEQKEFFNSSQQKQVEMIQNSTTPKYEGFLED